MVDNVIQFPTPREQAGVSMVEDMNGLLDSLMGAMIAVTHSENISELDRDAELEVLSNIFVKYFTLPRTSILRSLAQRAMYL